jgi:broad specificity phosphatase PhoE
MSERIDQGECLLYLIRHGATANNLAHPPRLQGRRTDPELSEQGRSQAMRTGRWLAGQRLDAVYSSPLLRARQTADEIAKPGGRTVELIDGLIEVDVGRWEGLTWEEIDRRWPEQHRLFFSDASRHPYLDGENLSTVQSRAIPTLAGLMAANPGRRVAAVSHNVVIRAYLAYLLGMPLRDYRSIPQDNCGVNLIRYAHGKPKLVSINAVGHLLEHETNAIAGS